MGPESNDKCSNERKERKIWDYRDPEGNRQRGRSCEDGARIVVMCLSQGAVRTPTATRNWGWGVKHSPSEPPEGTSHLTPLSLTSKIMREYISVFFFLNWRIIALQYCIHFFCTTTWISYMYTYILPLEPSLHSTSLGPHGAPSHFCHFKPHRIVIQS